MKIVLPLITNLCYKADNYYCVLISGPFYIICHINRTITDLATVKNVLNGTIEGTIQEIYDTQPYFSAVWEAMKVRRAWNTLLKESTQPFGINGL